MKISCLYEIAFRMYELYGCGLGNAATNRFSTIRQAKRTNSNKIPLIFHAFLANSLDF